MPMVESKIDGSVAGETAPMGETVDGRYAHLMNPGDNGFTEVMPNADSSDGAESAGVSMFTGNEANEHDDTPGTMSCHPEYCA